jgi:hypothetical protein
MYYFLSGCVGDWLDPFEALALADEGQAFARSRGLRALDLSIRGERVCALLRIGRWAELLADSEEVINEATAAGQMNTVHRVADRRSWILAEMGRLQEARTVVEFLMREGRETDASDYSPVRVQLMEQVDGTDAAGRYIDQAVRELVESRTVVDASYPMELALRALAVGRVDVAVAAASIPVVEFDVSRDASRQEIAAVIAEGHEQFEAAVDGYLGAREMWRGLGDPYETARAGYRAGCCLLSLGRDDEARSILEEARDTFNEIGASTYGDKADRLLEALRQPKA